MANRTFDAIHKVARRIPSGSKAARTKFENKIEEKALLLARCAEPSTEIPLKPELANPVIIRRASAKAKYIELHARSAFSFLEGSSLPEDLIERCAELGQPSMALLDAHGVYGCPRF